MSAMPASIRANFSPLDDSARDGRYVLVSNLQDFALARWTGEAFALSGGKDTGFTPTHFYRAPRQHSDDFTVTPMMNGSRVTDFEVRS